MAQMRSAIGPLSRVRERVRVRARELRQFSPEAERLLWRHLRDRRLGGYKFRRQHPVGPYFADFACVEARLIIELDGGQHYEPDAIDADTYRTQVLAAHGFHVLRFDDRQMLSETAAVLNTIHDWLQSNHPHPDPLPLAGEGIEPKETPHG